MRSLAGVGDVSWVGERGLERFLGSFGGLGRLGGPLCLLLILALAPSISGCRPGNEEKLGERVIPLGQPVPKGGGKYRVGQPYEIAGVQYHPKEDPNYDRVGTASWYGELFHGRRTANGEIYDMDRLSAAHPTLPLPIYARVTNLNNGRSIIVRVNDRGPYAYDRIIDLSRRSAEVLGYRHKGTATVRVQYLRRAPLNGDDSYEQRHLASQRWVRLASKKWREQVAVKGPIAVSSVPAGARTPPVKRARVAATPAALPPPKPKPESQPARSPEPAQPTVASLPFDKRLSIQAGSFKVKDNADRAISVLAGVGVVDVAAIEVRGSTYFRVRVGPFADAAAAKAALARVTRAGYRGAKIINN